ncbi:MAG TPA: TOBE domain-containing protein, partial [Actinomycetota bacterium]
PHDRVRADVREARLGVRPEKIRIAPGESAPPEGRNAIRGRLLVSTYVGVSSVYTVEAPGGEQLTVYAQNVDAPGERAPATGEEVVLSWHPQHTFVVEPD